MGGRDKIATFGIKLNLPFLKSWFYFSLHTMRRCLPRTLLRPVQVALRPGQTAGRRFESTTSTVVESIETQPSSSSTEITQAESSNPTRLLTPDLISKPRNHSQNTPAELHPSVASLKRTTPQRVQYRKDVFFPDHPKFASDLNDPELYDTEREVPKRMPHKEEKMFEIWRSKGFFPGDPIITRTHFLEIEKEWKSRVRGTILKHWNGEKGEWEVKHRYAFYIKKCLEKGYSLDNVKDATISLKEISKTRRELIKDIHPEELLPTEVKRHLGLDMEKFNLAFIDGQWANQVLPAEKDDPWHALTKEEVQVVESKLEHIVNWQLLDERTTREGTIPDRSAVKEEIVGYRVYLPNITVRLVRNHTEIDQPYDPYVATFRIPTSMTKTDLRSYLKAVYDLDVTFIRTDIYVGQMKRDNLTGRVARERGSLHNYKKAVVGLYQPFHYPDDIDELRSLGRATGRGDEMYDARMESLEETHWLERSENMRKKYLLKIFKGTRRHRTKGVQNRVSRFSSSYAHRFPLLMTELYRQEYHGEEAREGERHSWCRRGNASQGQAVSGGLRTIHHDMHRIASESR